MEVAVGDSGQFRWTGTESVNVLEFPVHYITVADIGSFHFMGGAVLFRRVIPRRKGRKEPR